MLRFGAGMVCPLLESPDKRGNESIGLNHWGGNWSQNAMPGQCQSLK